MRHLLALAFLMATASSATAQVRRVSVGDATLAYAVAGAGKPIVFIHGWAQDHAIWPDQIAAFSSRYRVITYDKRGFGESTGHADPTADPDDLRILLDSLGIQQAYIVGLSRGARTALNFTVAFPNRVAAVVLYGLGPVPGFQPAPTGPRLVERFGEIARVHGLDSVYKIVMASPLAWEPAGLTAEQKAARQAFQRAWWARYKGRDLLDPRPPSGRVPIATLSQVNSIRVPTLIIHGDHEMATNQAVADSLTRRIPGVSRVVIRNAGHGAHFDNPNEFNRALQAFLENVEGERRAPRRINVGDAELRYELTGRGQTVVFVHGWANTLEIWDDQVPEFSKRYQVLRYDRRGFGRSTGNADISADPDDLRILLDSLGIDAAYVVGLSAGSDVATRFAFTYPNRTLALVRLSGPPPEGMPGAPPVGRENREAMAHVLRTYGMDSLHQFVLARVGYVPPDETESERQRRLSRQRPWDYTGQDLLDPRPPSGKVPAVRWTRIRELRVPTLLINGAHDGARALMAADSLARHLPNAQKILIPRAGHAANLGQPDEFNRIVLNFLAAQPLSGTRR